MKKWITFLIAMALVTACDNDNVDPCENTPLPDSVGAFLITALVDADGANLIQNGTYPESDIKVSIDGIDMLTGVSEDTNQFGETRKVIVLEPARKKRGQIALLTLNETITDTILINLTEFEEKNACFNSVFHKFNSVLYNGQPQALNSEFVPRITVVKE